MNKKELIGGVAVICKDDKHLLICQSSNKPNAGTWRHPGGKNEPGEPLWQGIQREIREETGLEIELISDKPVKVLPSEYDSGNFGFFMARIIGGEVNMDEGEISEYGWFTAEEAKKLNLMEATRKFYDEL